MNKIGWCDMTWNPVWGCRNHCEYCYARGIVRRFWKQMYRFEFLNYCEKHPNRAWTGDHLWGLSDFIPTFLHSQFDKKLPKKPQRIFVGSMSEIRHWQEEWVERVIEKVKEYPQHTFQFLTKFPQVYVKYDFPKNCWLGMTITKKEDINKNWIRLYRATYALINNRFLDKNTKFYYSIEPILDGINPEFLKGIDWVIIGAETGNRKNKVIPNGSWVFNMLDYCNRQDIPIYIKDNIVKYYSEFGEYKQFPKGVKI